MTDILQVQEGVQYQGKDETIVYKITTTNLGSTPTNVSVKAYDQLDKSDVTSTVFPTNSPSVSGDVITLSPLKSLTAGRTYHIEILFTISTNIFEPYIPVICVR